LSLQVQNLATKIPKRSFSSSSVYKVLFEVSNINNNESIKFVSHACAELRAISPDFIEWFRGFVDGEGNFSIKRDHNTFAFSFQIKLHIDDVNVLHFIKSNLKMGNVRSYTLNGVLEISKKSEVQALIDIFSHYPLNTTKRLNFDAWAKGFNLLQSYRVTKDPNLLEAIANLKAEMNNSRVDFSLSNFSVNITPQWFMGFFEGEGSVFVSRKDFTLSISIGQALIDEHVMLKIAEFLNQLPGANFFKSDGVVRIYRSEGTIGHSRGKIELVISQTNFLKSVLIPFFNAQQWYGKKHLDFVDFQVILSLKEKGHHYSKQGKDLIDLILSQMNNNRLSTSNKTIVDRDNLSLQIQTLLNKPSNLELRKGRVWIISEARFQSEGGKSKALELRDDLGNLVNTFKSISECGKYLSISPTSVSRLIKRAELFTHNNKNVIISYSVKT
jgi:intein-encoded DNA endonuclease-like protein